MKTFSAVRYMAVMLAVLIRQVAAVRICWRSLIVAGSLAPDRMDVNVLRFEVWRVSTKPPGWQRVMVVGLL